MLHQTAVAQEIRGDASDELMEEHLLVEEKTLYLLHFLADSAGTTLCYF